jgi:hypothetical protein
MSATTMSNCTRCGYNLAAHHVGELCPECGAPITTLYPAYRPNSTLAIAGLGLAILLAVAMFIWQRDVRFVYAWGAEQVLALLLLAVTLAQARRMRGRRRWASVFVGMAAMVGPLITLTLFLAVFVIGGSSNVAQLAGNRADLWSLWFDAWPILLLVNPLSVALAVVSAALPPYGMRYAGAWALPCAVLACAVAAAHVTFRYFPDA